MANRRMLSRSISTDGRFNKLTIVEQWVFMRMLPFTDDHGRLPGDLIELRLLTIPGSTISNADFEDALSKLDEIELIYYDRGSVIQYRSFERHQTFKHRKAESIYPKPKQHVKEKTREPKKVGKPEKIQKSNVTNIVNTFDDFWSLGFKRTDRKKCMVKWLEIPDEHKKGMMDYARRFLNGRKSRQNPYTFLALKKWETDLVISTTPADYTQLPSGHYRAFCSSCGKDLYATALQLGSTSVCCDAPLSPDRPLPKKLKPNYRNL